MQNKKILITGASKGIGRAIAIEASQNDFDLILTARNYDELSSLRDRILSCNPKINVTLIKAELGRVETRIRFIDQIKKDHPDLNVLINNAGIYQQGLIYSGEEEVFNEMMQINFYAAFQITRSLIPNMIQMGKGHIINICSIAGLDPYPGSGLYSISKFALQGFSRSLREELKDKNIKVTTIYPGATWSNSWEGSGVAETRIMKAEDIAKIVITALQLSSSAVMEEIVLRPQLGDLS